MRVTFLGTSSGVPTMSRNVSCVALSLPQRAETWLFDCGEGTQHQVMRSAVKASHIRRIFITHMHGDHVFGLVGLLATLSTAGNPTRIDVYGPPGIRQFVEYTQSSTQTYFSYDLVIHEVEPGVVHEESGLTVRCEALTHRIPAYGYRVEEAGRAGALDPVKARALGIPAGPMLSALKSGQKVELENGSVVTSDEVCGPPQPGRVFAYCTDTVFCDASITLAHRADLVIHESTYAVEADAMARERGHSTCAMAAQVAKQADAKHLVLTHFSARYAPGSPEMDELLNTAKAIFPNTSLAEDFASFDIPLK